MKRPVALEGLLGIVSLAALTVLDAGPVGQIEAAHAAGFDHVGLRLQPLVAGDRTIVGDDAAERAVRDALARTGLRVLEIGVFPIAPETQVENWGPTLAFSHRIGARYIVCPVEDADAARRVATLRTLAALAETCALVVLIEFNPYSACRTLAEAAAIARAVQRPNVKLLVDVLHLSRSGGSPDDLRAYDAADIPLVHFCDAPAPQPSGSRSLDALRTESRTARLSPGEGALWLDELLAVIVHDTAISVEAPSAAHAHLSAAERARHALDATRRVLARVGR